MMRDDETVSTSAQHDENGAGSAWIRIDRFSANGVRPDAAPKLTLSSSYIMLNVAVVSAFDLAQATRCDVFVNQPAGEIILRFYPDDHGTHEIRTETGRGKSAKRRRIAGAGAVRRALRRDVTFGGSYPARRIDNGSSVDIVACTKSECEGGEHVDGSVPATMRHASRLLDGSKEMTSDVKSAWIRVPQYPARNKRLSQPLLSLTTSNIYLNAAAVTTYGIADGDRCDILANNDKRAVAFRFHRDGHGDHQWQADGSSRRLRTSGVSRLRAALKLRRTFTGAWPITESVCDKYSDLVAIITRDRTV